MSDSPGLVDFVIRLVNSVLNFPYWQMIFFLGNSHYRGTVINPAHENFFHVSLNDSWAGTLYMLVAACTYGKQCKTDFLCTLFTPRVNDIIS